MSAPRFASRAAAYAWASPNSALGLIAGLLVLLLGGRARVVSGTAEFHGGVLGRFVASHPGSLRLSAVTLGHVILGVSAPRLDALRAHERVHVRQYERWGPFFLPAYALSSLRQLAHGRHWYRDNAFERQASDVAGPRAAARRRGGDRGR